MLETTSSRLAPIVRACLVGAALTCAGLAGAGCTGVADAEAPKPIPLAASATEAVLTSVAPSAVAPDASSGVFVALTYNVAGLPELISRSRPSVYTPIIGRKLNGYDLVLLQESWQTPSPNPAAPLRCYHELLVANAEHRYKSPPAPQPFGNDPRRPSALLADGLNVFSKLPLEPTLRKPWGTCVESFNDCYALKGFSMTPMQLAPGVTVHVYNLHMEAGWTDADDRARDEAIEQLLTFIELHSRGEALIVGGDFNLRGGRAGSAAQLARLLQRGGLRDACAGCARPGNVDKVLYRGSERVELAAESWRLETDVFRSDQGAPLSDHAPLAVRFRWAKRDPHAALEAALGGGPLGEGSGAEALKID